MNEQQGLYEMHEWIARLPGGGIGKYAGGQFLDRVSVPQLA